MLDEELFFDRSRGVSETGQKLPHWDQGAKLYHATLRLHDSIPASVLAEHEQRRQAFIAAHPGEWSQETRKEYYKEFRVKLDRFLDAGHGSCLLSLPGAADIVEQSLLHGHGSRYTLYAYAIAANHLHALFSLDDESRLPDVMRGWKSYTAHAINRLAARRGAVWQREYYDTIMRGDEHYRAVLSYIQRHVGRVRY